MKPKLYLQIPDPEMRVYRNSAVSIYCNCLQLIVTSTNNHNITKGVSLEIST